MAIRTSEAEWRGDLKTGQGGLKLAAALSRGLFVSIAVRGTAKGTKPRRIVGAGHAGCFTMALAARLAAAGHTAPGAHHGKSAFGPVPGGGGFAITRVDLATEGSVPGIDAATFGEAAAGRQGELPGLEKR